MEMLWDDIVVLVRVLLLLCASPGEDFGGTVSGRGVVLELVL